MCADDSDNFLGACLAQGQDNICSVREKKVEFDTYIG